jgi:hypothetical protein
MTKQKEIAGKLKTLQLVVSGWGAWVLTSIPLAGFWGDGTLPFGLGLF